MLILTDHPTHDGLDPSGAAQSAPARGTTFTFGGVGVGVYAAGAGASMLFCSGVAAALGLVGAAIALVAVVSILILKEDDWIVWLRDVPLNVERKGKPPVHNNLSDTHQKLANAIPAAVI